MKLRVRAGALRLRLTRGEIARLRETGRVEERVVFAPGSELVYAVTSRPDAASLHARYDAGGVHVVVPEALARDLCDSDRVGIEARQDAGDGATLVVLIEKDWQCLKPREDEDDADAFPHPLLAPRS